MNSSTYYFHMKTKILADFQICTNVPLRKNGNTHPDIRPSFVTLKQIFVVHRKQTNYCSLIKLYQIEGNLWKRRRLPLPIHYFKIVYVLSVNSS